MCALFVSSVIDASSFLVDNDRPMTLKAKVIGAELEISFPSLEVGYEDLVCQRTSTLFVYAEADCKFHGYSS
jgi:hypothetical protein